MNRTSQAHVELETAAGRKITVTANAVREPDAGGAWELSELELDGNPIGVEDVAVLCERDPLYVEQDLLQACVDAVTFGDE